MDRETTQRLLRESIVFLCRTHLGADAANGFEVDGIICISRRRRQPSDCYDDPRPVVFKFHELVTENTGTLMDSGPNWLSRTSSQSSIAALLNRDTFPPQKKRNADELLFDDPSTLLSKRMAAGNDQHRLEIPAGMPELCLLKEEPSWARETPPNTFETIQMLMTADDNVAAANDRSRSRKAESQLPTLAHKSASNCHSPDHDQPFDATKGRTSARSAANANEPEIQEMKPTIVSSNSLSDEPLSLNQNRLPKLLPIQSLSMPEIARPQSSNGSVDDGIDDGATGMEQSTPRECDICGSSFTDFPTYNVHCTAVHGRYACPFCALSFPCESTRERHLFEHTGEQVDDDENGDDSNYGLDMSTTRTSSRLSGGNTVEILSDSEDGMGTNGGAYDSQLLSRRGTLSTQALRAIVSLDPSRPFVCDICRAQFTAPSALCDHTIAVHRRIPCPYCGRSFSQKASMERHQRQHTGERPYRCTLCECSYTRKENLQTHFTRAHAAGNTQPSGVMDFVGVE